MGAEALNGLLLDTHVWLWQLRGAPELPETIRAEIDERREELWLSPVSVWEVGLLGRRGRVRLELPLRDWVDQALGRLPVQQALLTYEVAITSEEVELPHRDPADRFLAATAIVYDLELMTVDQRLLDAPSVPTRSA